MHLAQTELEHAKNELEQTKRRLATISKDLETCSKAKDTALKSAATADTKLAAELARNTELKAQLSEVNSQLTELKTQQTTNATENTITAINKALSETETKFIAESTNLQTAYSDMNKRVDLLSDELAAIKLHQTQHSTNAPDEAPTYASVTCASVPTKNRFSVLALPETSNQDDCETTEVSTECTSECTTRPSAQKPQSTHSSRNQAANRRLSNGHVSQKEVDLLLIGNSNTYHVSKEKMYRHKKCFVKTLDSGQKNLDGASAYIQSCSLNPKVIIFQAASNSLVNESVETCTRKTEMLLKSSKDKYPEVSLCLAVALPRRLETRAQTEAYQSKIDQYNSNLRQLAPDLNFTVIEHPNLQDPSDDHFGSDNLHLSRKGVIALVRNYKNVVNPLFGMKAPFEYDSHRQQNISPQQRSRSG